MLNPIASSMQRSTRLLVRPDVTLIVMRALANKNKVAASYEERRLGPASNFRFPAQRAPGSSPAFRNIGPGVGHLAQGQGLSLPGH